MAQINFFDIDNFSPYQKSAAERAANIALSELGKSADLVSIIKFVGTKVGVEISLSLRDPYPSAGQRLEYQSLSKTNGISDWVQIKTEILDLAVQAIAERAREVSSLYNAYLHSQIGALSSSKCPNCGTEF